MLFTRIYFGDNIWNKWWEFAAEEAESRAKAAQNEAADLRNNSSADLKDKEEGWHARHVELEAEVRHAPAGWKSASIM